MIMNNRPNERRAVNLLLKNEDYNRILEYGKGSGMTAGVLNILNRIDNISRYSMLEIRKFFTPAEWKAIAASLNGTIVDEVSHYSIDIFLASCEDAELYDGTFTQFGVDIAAFRKKACRLKCSQLVAVYDRVEDFWESSKNGPCDIEKWAEY